MIDKESALTTVKALLGGLDGRDELLNSIIDTTEARLANLLGQSEVPEALAYIVPEVSVIRFNRLGSEGASAHSVEGESITFSADDFSGFRADIQAWKDKQLQQTTGTVYFL